MSFLPFCFDWFGWLARLFYFFFTSLFWSVDCHDGFLARLCLGLSVDLFGLVGWRGWLFFLGLVVGLVVFFFFLTWLFDLFGWLGLSVRLFGLFWPGWLDLVGLAWLLLGESVCHLVGVFWLGWLARFFGLTRLVDSVCWLGWLGFLTWLVDSWLGLSVDFFFALVGLLGLSVGLFGLVGSVGWNGLFG